MREPTLSIRKDLRGCWVETLERTRALLLTRCAYARRSRIACAALVLGGRSARVRRRRGGWRNVSLRARPANISSSSSPPSFIYNDLRALRRAYLTSPPAAPAWFSLQRLRISPASACWRVRIVRLFAFQQRLALPAYRSAVAAQRVGMHCCTCHAVAFSEPGRRVCLCIPCACAATPARTVLYRMLLLAAYLPCCTRLLLPARRAHSISFLDTAAGGVGRQGDGAHGGAPRSYCGPAAWCSAAASPSLTTRGGGTKLLAACLHLPRLSCYRINRASVMPAWRIALLRFILRRAAVLDNTAYTDTHAELKGTSVRFCHRCACALPCFLPHIELLPSVLACLYYMPALAALNAAASTSVSRCGRGYLPRCLPPPARFAVLLPCFAPASVGH